MGRPLRPVYIGPFREVNAVVDADPCLKQSPRANETCWAERAYVQIVTEAGSQTIPIAPWISEARTRFSEIKPARVFPPDQPIAGNLEGLPPGKVTTAIDVRIIYADATFPRRFAAVEDQGIWLCRTCGPYVEHPWTTLLKSICVGLSFILSAFVAVGVYRCLRHQAQATAT